MVHGPPSILPGASDRGPKWVHWLKLVRGQGPWVTTWSNQIATGDDSCLRMVEVTVLVRATGMACLTASLTSLALQTGHRALQQNHREQIYHSPSGTLACLDKQQTSQHHVGSEADKGWTTSCIYTGDSSHTQGYFSPSSTTQRRFWSRATFPHDTR